MKAKNNSYAGFFTSLSGSGEAGRNDRVQVGLWVVRFGVGVPG